MGDEPTVEEKTVEEEQTRIVVQSISAAAFETFGWLPVADDDPSDGSARLEFTWADPHVNVIAHRPEELTHAGGKKDAFVCDRMYRHDSHTQALLVLDQESVLAVAPAATELTDQSALALIKAFRLRPHDAVVLWRGTWHWGPFPLGDEPVHLYNLQGRGYEKDNRSVDLSAMNVVVTV